jgi:hypothetical protein
MIILSNSLPVSPVLFIIILLPEWIIPGLSLRKERMVMPFRPGYEMKHNNK